MYIFFIYIFCASALIYTANEKNIKTIIRVVCVGFATLAFFQKVQTASDLTMAFQHLNNLRIYGWDYFNQISSFHFTGRFSQQVYFYLLSFLPVNNFYSGISMFIVYYCMLMSVHEIAVFNNVKFKNEKILLLLAVFLADFYDYSNGVRNIMAFSIFIYFFVGEITKYKNKYICWFMYIVAATFHTAVWPLIIFRILLVVEKKWFKWLVGCITVVWSNGLSSVANFLNIFASIPAVQGIQHGLRAYTEGTGGNYAETVFNMSSSYLLMRSFRLFLAFAILIMILFVWTRKRNLSTLMTYGLYMTAFTLGAAVSGLATNILSRYSLALILLCPLLYGEFSTLQMPKKYLKFDSVRIELVACLLGIVAILFNYYFFRYHYPSLDFVIKFIK